MGGEAAEGFAYHRSLAPMLWVLVALATCELLVVHLLVSLWSGRVALVLSAFSLAGLLWLIAAMGAMRRLPVLLDRDRLIWRVGRLKRIDVPTSVIAGLRDSWDAAAVRQRNVLNLALIAYPNVVIEIDPPIARGRRRITALAHRLDDPAGFASALRRIKGER